MPTRESKPVSVEYEFFGGLGTMLLTSKMGALTPVVSNVTVDLSIKLLGKAAGSDMFLSKE